MGVSGTLYATTTSNANGASHSTNPCLDGRELPEVASLPLKRTLKQTILAASAVLILGSASAHAVAIVSGDTIIGVFSDPVYTGNILNDPSVGQTLFTNSSATAPASTIISNGGSTLQWGTNPGSTVPPADQYSQLVFTGESNLPATFSTPKKVGTIYYVNGTSANTSAVFGATLSFYLNSVNPANLVATDNVIISATENQYSGTGLTPSQLQTDADYVNICGNDSNICGSSIEAYEDSEGGVGVSMDLYGTLDDLILTSVSLTPGQNPLTSGTVGDLPPLGAVPEPASLAIIGVGIFGLAGLGRRRRKVNVFH